MYNLLIHITYLLAQTSHVSNCPLASGNVCDTNLPAVAASNTELGKVLTIVFGVLGVVSVIMVVIGGLQFVISQGDAQAAARARMTIIYAAVGLAISVTAEAIVGFVLNKF